jgi:hypothetical protein
VNEARASGADTSNGLAEDAPPEEYRGPHLWLNWQGQLVGQPARDSSHGESVLVHPRWEERALYSDAEITGEIEFGPYAVLMTLAGGSRLGRAVQTLVFRHRDHLDEAPPGQMQEELDVEGWTGGDIGDQMAALLALALGRRIRSGGVVRQGFEPGDPLGRPLAPTHYPPTLVEPKRAPMLPGVAAPAQVPTAARLLERYGKLRGGDAAALTRAAGQYADALWWADADPRISWIKLVGALEAAANRWDLTQDDSGDAVALLKRHRGALYGRLKRIDARAVELVANALAGMMNVERKLLAFTLNYAPAPPERRPGGARVDFNDLEPALRQIYEWRSRDLHDGIPFPPPLCEPPIGDANGPYERFPALGVQDGGGYWPAEVLPMYLHVFAHVVGGALRNWWRDLPAPGPPDAGGDDDR